jgi:hypothetical protein
MKDTKKFFTLLFFPFFFIAVAFTISCSSPIGSLLDNIDYIKAVPSKSLYGQKDWFKPAKDLKVIGVFSGVEDEIDINKVEIKIIEDPLSTPNEIIVNNNQEGCFLENKGPKTVVITYRDLEARYDIAVGEPGTGEIGWGDGGTGITIDYW